MAALLAKALAIAVIVHAPCPGASADWSCAAAPNTIYLEASPPPGTLNHELGHLVDYNLLMNADRGMFEAIMHMHRPWVDAPNSPHEQFAEAVRLCAQSVRWPSRAHRGYGYEPTRYEHRKVCRWLASIGAR